MKYFFPIFLVLITLLAGCKGKSDLKLLTSEKPKDLRTLVNDAINGDIKANTQLSGLIDHSLPKNKDYNKLKIDSLRIDGKMFVYILLEYANPVYNRLAVYDRDLHLFLLDKSLNGDISFDIISEHGMQFIKIVESFLSKDIINIKRLSLYKIEPTKINLVFRTIISMNKPDAFFLQEVSSIDRDSIVTTIELPSKKKTVSQRDVFRFSPADNSYKSRQNIFETEIRKQISDIKTPALLPEITDKQSVSNTLNKQ